MRRLADDLAAFFADRDRLKHPAAPMKAPEPTTGSDERLFAERASRIGSPPGYRRTPP
jgi:hypothetical protein